MFRSIRLRLPEAILAAFILFAAWFLSARLSESDLPLRLLLTLGLPVLLAAAVLLSGVPRRDLRLLMSALAGILLLLRLVWFVPSPEGGRRFLCRATRPIVRL